MRNILPPMIAETAIMVSLIRKSLLNGWKYHVLHSNPGFTAMQEENCTEQAWEELHDSAKGQFHLKKAANSWKKRDRDLVISSTGKNLRLTTS